MATLQESRIEVRKYTSVSTFFRNEVITYEMKSFDAGMASSRNSAGEPHPFPNSHGEDDSANIVTPKR